MPDTLSAVYEAIGTAWREGMDVAEAEAQLERLLVRLSAVEAERDEWKAEAERKGWPKEAAQELFRLRVALPAAEARVEALSEALRTIAESHAYDHSVDGPGAEGSTPYEWARRAARAALTAAPPVPEQRNG